MNNSLQGQSFLSLKMPLTWSLMFSFAQLSLSVFAMWLANSSELVPSWSPGAGCTWESLPASGIPFPGSLKGRSHVEKGQSTGFPHPLSYNTLSSAACEYSWVASYSSIDVVSSYAYIAWCVAQIVRDLRQLYFCAQHGFLWSIGFASRSKCLSRVVFAGLFFTIVNYYLILIFLCLGIGAVWPTVNSKTQKLLGTNLLVLGVCYRMKYIHGFMDS